MSPMRLVAGQQHGAHLGGFLHVLKTAWRAGSTHKRKAPWVMLKVVPASAERWGRPTKQMIPLIDSRCSTPTGLYMLLHTHWIISHAIPCFPHTPITTTTNYLPHSILPFPGRLEPFTANYGFCNWENHVRKWKLCGSLFAPGSPAPLSLPPVEPHWLRLMPRFDCEESKYIHKMALCISGGRGPGSECEPCQFWNEPHLDLEVDHRCEKCHSAI